MKTFYYKIRKRDEEFCNTKAEIFCEQIEARNYIEFLRDEGYSVRKISRREYERGLPLRK